MAIDVSHAWLIWDTWKACSHWRRLGDQFQQGAWVVEVEVEVRNLEPEIVDSERIHWGPRLAQEHF